MLGGVVGGYQIAIENGLPGLSLNKNFAIIIYMILGAAIGYVIGGIVGRKLIHILTRLEDSLQNVPIGELIIGIAGLVAGLVIAFLVTLPFALISIPVLRLLLTGVVYVVFAWLGIRLGAGRRAEVKDVLSLGNGAVSHKSMVSSGIGDKILDTNIVIDGRIIDVIKSGFLEGAIVIPRFVLHELQAVADSSDSLKRVRGRRGLDILRSLQTDLNFSVQVDETDYPDVFGVDAKLVRLARETGAVIVTNDYNLNKVAQLEGVKVLNLNDLANAVKAVVLPGEEMVAKVVREGKERGQGVGFLEDGTMIVVEDGANHIGQTVELKVTSVLQTPAGRMIFTKIKAAAHI